MLPFIFSKCAVRIVTLSMAFQALGNKTSYLSFMIMAFFNFHLFEYNNGLDGYDGDDDEGYDEDGGDDDDDDGDVKNGGSG